MKTLSDLKKQADLAAANRWREDSDVTKLGTFRTDDLRTDDNPFPGGSPSTAPEPPPPAVFAPTDVAPTDHPDPIVDMVLTAIVSAVVRGDKAAEVALRTSLAKYMASPTRYEPTTRGA